MKEKSKGKAALWAPTTGGIFCCSNDPEWTLLEADKSLYQFLGYSRQEFEETCENRMTRVVHPDDLRAMQVSFDKQLQDGQVVFGECRLIGRDKTVKWVWISARLMRFEAGREYFYCMFHDVSDRVLAQQRLELSENRYDIIMQLTQDIIFEWDCFTGDIFYSTNFEKKFGYKPPESGYPECIADTGIIHEEDRQILEDSVRQLNEGAHGIVVEHRMKKNDGSYLWVKVSATVIRNEDGSMRRVLGIISDIQQQKQTMMEAKEQASRDSLSGLYNRGSTKQLVDEYLAKSAGPAAMLVIDVDNFKGVNDTLGHSYGDVVLSDISDQLKGLFRSSDILGRVGGDEFVVFLENVSDEKEVLNKADRIRNIFHRGLSERGVQYEITCSIGAALYPKNGSTYQELFDKADVAMYVSKGLGKNRCTIYEEGLRRNSSEPPLPSVQADAVKAHSKNFRDHMIEYLFKILLENPDVKKAMPALMDLIGKFYRLDRIYLYEAAEDDSNMICTFEWCGPGIPSMKEKQKVLECRKVQYDRKHLEESYLYTCFDTSQLAEENNRFWFEKRGTRSSLQCPILDDGRLAVLVGFEICGKPRLPEEESRSTLSLASEAMGLVLLRARKQEQLQSVARYRADAQRINFLTQNIPGGLIGGYLRDGFPFYFINDRMLRYLGYESREEFVEAVDGLLINGVYREDRETVKQEIEAQLTQKEEYEVVHRMIKKDGSYIWVRDIGKVMATESGGRAVVSLCIDVTEQLALKNQLELYRTAARGGAFIVRLDEGFTILYGNDIFYRLHEYTKEEVEQEFDNQASRLVDPRDLPRVYEEINNAFAAGKTGVQWEMRSLTKSKRARWLLATGTFEYLGADLVLNGFITDLTELRTLQEQTAKNEQLYRIALRQTNVSVWEYDLASHTIQMAESAETWHAYQDCIRDVPESLIQDGHIHPISQEEFRTLYRKIHEGEEYAQADILTRTPDRKGWWWERISYTNLFDDAGKPVRAVAVGQDVTRQKEAELNYQKELQMRQALSEGIIASSRADLTKDRVEMLRDRNAPEEAPAEGLTFENLMQLEAAQIANPNDRKRYLTVFEREAMLEGFDKGRQNVSMEYRRREPGGNLIWVNTQALLVTDAASGDVYAYGSVRDIDTQKMLEQALLQRAEKDILTDTYNKETAVRMMEDALARAKRVNRQPVLLLFAVDHFSRLISKSGYTAAERVMRELADLLHLKFGREQIVGRFYGDELVLFLPDSTGRKEVCGIAQEICRTMEESCLFTGMETPVTLSVGITLEGKRSRDFRTFYRQAYVALEAAKASGEDSCVIVYTPRLQEGGTPNFAALPKGWEEAGQTGYADARDILLRCAMVLASSWEFSKAAEPILSDIAAYYGADRAYLLLQPGELKAAAFYEWKKAELPPKEGLAAFAGRREKVSPEEFGAALKEQGTEEVYILPLENGDRQLGFLGVEAPACNRGRMTLMETVCQSLSNEIGNREYRDRHEYLRYHDDMTGLSNRSSFQEYSESLHEESLISLGVVSVDINGLKRMNNKYGIGFGDKIVRDTARNMQEAFGGGKLYRFAGDEFLALCENLAQETFLEKVGSFRSRMEAVYPSCISVGVIWADSDIHLDEMIGHADERMLVAKQEYYQNLDTITKGHDPFLLQKLLEGIGQGAYCMFLQPKAKINTGGVEGAEALVRFYDAGGGIVGPDKFVPGLEREGLIRYIDLFIFEEVCRALHTWQEEGRPLITVSLNFSRATLLEENLIETMEKIRDRYQVEAGRLEIEITESAGVMEQDALARIGRQIRQQGYRLSLDDFGAKYSNIATLSVLELNVLKLDKSLVNDLISCDNQKIIVRNFLHTCKELGIESVAEGVETREQLQILRELGCDYAQGYYFNKPVPRADFERLYLEEHIVK